MTVHFNSVSRGIVSKNW